MSFRAYFLLSDYAKWGRATQVGSCDCKELFSDRRIRHVVDFRFAIWALVPFALLQERDAGENMKRPALATIHAHDFVLR